MNGYSVSHNNNENNGNGDVVDDFHQRLNVGADVLARFNFNGNSPEDLPFQKNELLKIITVTKDPNWYKARNSNNREGMVPANYVRKISDNLSWFHGHISRDEAEKRLKDKPNGAFLVRESTNYPGDYTLCLLYRNKVEHYRVARKNAKFTCDDEEYFDTLQDLIEHYSVDADGLCHHLALPIPPTASSTATTNDVSDCVDGVVLLNGDTSRVIVDDVDQVDANFDGWTKHLKEAGFKIKRQDLVLGDTIGRGEFGDVLIGSWKGQKVAVKVLKHASQIVKAFLQEANLMASLKHKNLVQLLGVVLDNTSDLVLVVEFMSNGNLVDYLRSRGRQQVTKKQQINFACDACEGMSYVESKNLVHRDLAARNVLLSEDMTAKVSDFGLAKKVDLAFPEDASGKFPIKWTAPEALRHSRFTSKSDVWSFGILLWEIYSFGRVPYPRIPVQDVVRHIEKGYRMEPPEGCPPEIADLMNESWEFDANKRPSFNQILIRLQSIQRNVV